MRTLKVNITDYENKQLDALKDHLKKTKTTMVREALSDYFIKQKKIKMISEDGERFALDKYTN